MKPPLRLALSSLLLCILGATAAVLAVYRLTLFYERQGFGGRLSISIALTLHRLGSLGGGGVSEWYSIAGWVITIGSILCVLGGLAIAGAFRLAQAVRIGAFTVITCGLVDLSLFLFVGSGPGLQRNQPGVSYPRGPALFVGVCGAGLLIAAFGLALAAHRRFADQRRAQSSMNR